MANLCILATGGTIDKVHDPITEQLVFSDKSHVSQILGECRVRNIPHQIIMFKDSLEIDDHDRQTLKLAIMARSEQRIVVTHGTSTMPETAAFLDGHVGDKTIVLTGAMRPFSFFQSDAGFNLGGAIIAAQTLPAGVFIVMNGMVFKAGQVKKDLQVGEFVRTD